MSASASFPWKQAEMSKRRPGQQLVRAHCCRSAFGLSLDELKACMEPSRYVGRAPKQVDEFLSEVVNPILEANKEDLGMTAEITV